MPFDGNLLSTATLGAFTGSGVFSDSFTITPGTDVDIVRITLVAGRRYQVDIDDSGTGDLYLRIFDQFGTEVRANDDGFRANDDVVFSLSPFVEFTPNYGGFYYFAVSPYYLADYNPTSSDGRLLPENPITSVAGTLVVTDTFLANDWPDANAVNAISAEDANDETDMLREADRRVRVSYTGSLDAGDVDMARVGLGKGDVVVVDVNGLSGNGTVIRVFDDAGTQIGIDDDTGTGEDAELFFVAPSQNDYYIAISGDGNSTYAGLDGSSTLTGDTGDYEVIIHRNPTMIGTSNFSVLDGDVAPDYFLGLGGGDSLYGNDGNDTLAGGDDEDRLFGGKDRDVLYGEHGDDSLFGEGQRDVLAGGIGNDRLDGGADSDWLEGGTGDDSLFGGEGGFFDTLYGGDGLDQLSGGGGDDNLYGGAGNDSLLGDAQNDGLIGDAGNDTLRGGSGNDSLYSGTDDDSLFGDTGDDVLSGSSGNDTCDGGDGSDYLDGSTGLDVLFGGQGNDSLFGGNDADVLEGGDNQDRLAGGGGDDTLRGGAGADTFVFGPLDLGSDRIEDMVALQERIDLSAIFAAAGSVVTAANLSEYIQCTGGVDSTLAIDANGLTGGSLFTTEALVIGIAPGVLFDVNNFIL